MATQEDGRTLTGQADVEQNHAFVSPFVYPRDAENALSVLRKIKAANPDHGSLTIDEAIVFFSVENESDDTSDDIEDSLPKREYESRTTALFFNLLRPSDDKQDWRFKSIYDPDFLSEVYPDMLKGINHADFARKMQSLRGNAYSVRKALVKNITDLGTMTTKPDKVERRTMALLDEGRQIRRFRYTTNDEFIGYIQRRIPFPTITILATNYRPAPRVQNPLGILDRKPPPTREMGSGPVQRNK